METISNNKSLKIILVLMTVGIWIIVLQNAGIIPTKQKVYVKGGYIDVSGRVDIDNTVQIRGSVDVDNTVDINIREIIGNRAGCRKSYTIDGINYYSLDVSN